MSKHIKINKRVESTDQRVVLADKCVIALFPNTRIFTKNYFKNRVKIRGVFVVFHICTAHI